jgi:putative cell wall-binding protein
LGYQGFGKEYICGCLKIPHKKKRNSVLSEEQKNENKNISSTRVRVEHSIGGMKRYRILSERLRMHDYEEYDLIVGVCAGLWNFSQICTTD